MITKGISDSSPCVDVWETRMQDVPRLTVVDFRVWLVSKESWHGILIYRTL